MKATEEKAKEYFHKYVIEWDGHAENVPYIDDYIYDGDTSIISKAMTDFANQHNEALQEGTKTLKALYNDTVKEVEEWKELVVKMGEAYGQLQAENTRLKEIAKSAYSEGFECAIECLTESHKHIKEKLSTP